MKPIDVRIELDGEERTTKVRVHYHEGDTAEHSGRSAEVVVYVDRRGLRLPEISPVAIRSAEEFLRHILQAGGQSK
jgi:hypothetical protein